MYRTSDYASGYGYRAGYAVSESSSGIPLADGLINYWALEEDATGDVIDSVGGVTLVAVDKDNFPLTSSAGIHGNCLGTSNAGYGLHQKTGSYAMPAEFSFSTWAKHDSPASHTLIDVEDGVDFNAFYVGINTGTQEVTIYTNDYNDSIQESIAGPTFSNWTHFVVTYGAGVMKVYVNAVLKAQQSMTITNNPGNSILSTVFPGGEGPFIHQDEMGIWERELSAGDVVSLFNASSGKFYPTFA